MKDLRKALVILLSLVLCECKNNTNVDEPVNNPGTTQEVKDENKEDPNEGLEGKERPEEKEESNKYKIIDVNEPEFLNETNGDYKFKHSALSFYTVSNSELPHIDLVGFINDLDGYFDSENITNTYNKETGEFRLFYKGDLEIIFDINKDLINCYNVIKNNVEALIKKLDEKEKKYMSLEMDDRKEYFYDIRKEYNSYQLTGKKDIKRASEFIFLNKTCFNGLYRVNKKDEFNVPFNNAKKPPICDSTNLRNLSKLIKNVEFICGNYYESEQYIKGKTFVYFDPPYRPLNVTSGFTSYTKFDFNDEDQKKLAEYYSKIDSKNVKLMLSNSNPKNTDKKDTFFEDLYAKFNIHEIYAKRMINSKASGRGEISELLITNYKD